MLEVRILKYFQAVVEEGGFLKAASRLHITQPTLSRQIKELEEFYQIRLFDRNKHPITLTEEGKKLYHKSKQITELVDKLESDLTSKEELEGSIDVGTVESLGAKAIYDDLMSIYKENPKITFNFYNSDSDELKDRLDKSLIDLAVLTEPVELTNFNYLKLPELDKWYILVSTESKLAGFDFLNWDDLTDEPLLISKRFARFREFPEFFNAQNSSYNILATYSLFSNAVYFVENNLAVAPCIETVHSISNNPKVKLIPLEPEFKTGSYLVWKKDQIMNKPAQKVLDLLIKRIQNRSAQKAY